MGDERKRRAQRLASEVPAYLQLGFVLGRNEFHTDNSKAAIGLTSTKHHAEEQLKGDAYSYLPHGDQHHRRILGCPPEVAEKIRRSLSGRPKPPEHPVHQGIAKGKHWQWSEADRQKKSESLKGIAPTNGFSMKGRTHSEETRAVMSTSHAEFYSNNPDAVAALNASRPRGEAHVFFGKERSLDTRTKIAASLRARVQSEETKRKRAASLALAKLPPYSKEDIFVFTLLKTAPNKESRDSILKQVKGKTRKLAKGICLILDGCKDEFPRRYWRQAETWLTLNP